MRAPIVMRIFVCLLFLSPCTGGWAIPAYLAPGDTLFSAAELVADLHELKEKILEIHPNPFTYCTEEEFNAAFEAAKADVSDGMGYYEFASVVGSTLRVLRDSHSLLQFQSILQPYKAKEGRVLDIEVVRIADSLYVRKDSQNILPLGSRILKIGDVDAIELHDLVSRYSLIEGHSRSGFVRVTDAIFNNFAGLFVALSEATPLQVIAVGSSDTLSFSYPARKMGGKKKKREVKKENLAQFVLSFTESGARSIAHLKVGSFSDIGGYAYHRFLKRSFREIKKRESTDLVIDLRNNTGGRSGRVKSLMRYISGYAEIGVPSNMIAKQSESSEARFRSEVGRLPRFLVKTFSKKGSDSRKFIEMITMPVGSIDTVYFDTGNLPQPKHAFKGDKFLLINGLSGSGSVVFTSMFSINNWGQILGEPCLGPLTGTWGNPIPVKLSNTEIGVYIASMRFNVNNEFNVDPKPVMPTVFINEAPRDLNEQRDVSIEYIKQIKP